ncbi:MAG: hypothetical protein EAZ40_13235 [Rhodobacterales bacterium]|nr:MAG: hypothetical protein EAZ40_13235 [Rhodobacterales bacterium]
MSATSEEAGRHSEVVLLALQAWGVGLLTAALVVLPGMTVLDGLFTDPFLETILPRIIAFFGMMLPGVLMTFTVGVVLSLPFFLLGLLTALTFRRQISRYPMVFATLAPLVTVLLVATVTVLMRDPGPEGLRQALQAAMAVAMGGDSWIFALPVAAGSFFFCSRLARSEDHANGA